MMARIGRVKIMEGQKQSNDPKDSHLKIQMYISHNLHFDVKIIR